MTQYTEAPEPNFNQQIALEHLAQGIASLDDVKWIKSLIDDCGRFGCLYTKTSKSSKGMDICPGWCDLVNRFEQDRLDREQALTRKVATKPYKLSKTQVDVLIAIDERKLTLEELLTLEVLCKACATDGCINDPKFKDTPKSGITTCPKWCNECTRAWNVWWS